MKHFFWKFLMKKIDNVDEATELGKRYHLQKKENKDFDYRIIKLLDGDYIFKIMNGDKQIYEFICTPLASRFFLDEAVNF
jgi:predicted alpha/beta superfamily hydrolase